MLGKALIASKKLQYLLLELSPEPRIAVVSTLSSNQVASVDPSD
jgi:hypothetical protein